MRINLLIFTLCSILFNQLNCTSQQLRTAAKGSEDWKITITKKDLDVAKSSYCYGLPAFFLSYLYCRNKIEGKDRYALSRTVLVANILAAKVQDQINKDKDTVPDIRTMSVATGLVAGGAIGFFQYLATGKVAVLDLEREYIVHLCLLVGGINFAADKLKKNAPYDLIVIKKS